MIRKKIAKLPAPAKRGKALRRKRVVTDHPGFTFDEIAKRPSLTDWDKVDRMTDAEIEARALADPDAQPCTPEQLKEFRRVDSTRPRPAKRPRKPRKNKG